MEDQDRKVLNALETYFSDANLLWDKLMRQKISQNEQGSVAFDSLKTLPRFKALNATAEDIKRAAEKSSRLKVTEDGNGVCRIKPYVHNKKEELDDWSVYVEGLSKPYTNSEQISKLFTELVGHVSFVRIPTNLKGPEGFYGFAFVEFDDQACVQKALELDMFEHELKDKETTPNRKARSLNLRIMTKKRWKEYEQQYLQVMEERKPAFEKLWKDYQEAKQKEQVEEPAPKKARAEPANTESEESTKYPKGVIAVVSNIPPKTSKSSLKQSLEESGVTVAYTNFKKGVTTCHIRLNSSEDTQKIVKYFSDLAQTQPDTLQLRAITGNEEKIYWQNDPKFNAA